MEAVYSKAATNVQPDLSKVTATMRSYSAMEVNVQPNPAQERYGKISGGRFACCGVVVLWCWPLLLPRSCPALVIFWLILT